MKNIKRQLVNYRNAMVMHMWNVKNKLQDTSGEGYVDTAIKILIAVVLGALLLAGLYALFNDTVLPTLVRRVQEMFDYRSGYRCFRRYRQCFFSRCLLRFLPGIFGTGLFRTDSRQGLPCFPF